MQSMQQSDDQTGSRLLPFSGQSMPEDGIFFKTIGKEKRERERNLLLSVPELV